MGGKKKYIKMFGSFTEPFKCFYYSIVTILIRLYVLCHCFGNMMGMWPVKKILHQKSPQVFFGRPFEAQLNLE